MQADKRKPLAERAMTCLALSPEAGVSVSAIDRIMSGKGARPATVGLIARAPGVPVTQIIREE